MWVEQQTVLLFPPKLFKLSQEHCPSSNVSVFVVLFVSHVIAVFVCALSPSAVFPEPDGSAMDPVITNTLLLSLFSYITQLSVVTGLLILSLAVFSCVTTCQFFVFPCQSEQRDETSSSISSGLLQQQSSSLTQMFDPMIYSQELLHKQQQLDQFLQLQRSGDDGSGDLEGSVDSPSTGPSDVLSAAAIFRRDEHDSASRKTSTASDYTFSSSDYTPENTIVDGMDDQPAPTPAQDIVLGPSAAQPATQSPGDVPTTKAESPQSEPKTTPQRKISRFYVSPVNLNIPQQQIITMDTNKTIQVTVETTSETKITTQLDNVGSPAAAGATGKDVGENPGISSSGEMSGEFQNANANQNVRASSHAPSEQMNTLEQLKIGLENITHAHVIAAQQQQQQMQQQQGHPQSNTTTGTSISITTSQVSNVGPKISSVAPPQSLVSNIVPPTSIASHSTGAAFSVDISNTSVMSSVLAPGVSGGVGGTVSVGLVNVAGSMSNPAAVVPVILPSVSASSTNTPNVILVDGGCMPQPPPPLSSSSSIQIVQTPLPSQSATALIVPSAVAAPQQSSSVPGVVAQPTLYPSSNTVMNVHAPPSVVYPSQHHFQPLPPGLVLSQQLVQQQPGLVQSVSGQEKVVTGGPGNAQHSGTNNSSNSVSQTSSVMHSRRTSADVLSSSLVDGHPLSVDQVRVIRKHSSEERSMNW